MISVLYAIETSDPDGAEHMLINLAAALDPATYRPVVCLLQEGWLADEARRRRYPTYVFPLNRTVDLQWVHHARAMMAAEGIDLVHSHEFAMNTYCSLLAAMAGVPCVATVHGKNYSSDKWHRRLAYRAIARRSKFVAVSDDIKDFLANQVGVPAAHITTIANGIDIQKYSSARSSRTRVRGELGIAEDRVVIGCVGRLEPVKGHVYLLRAAAAICKRHPRAMFVFAGQGRLREVLQAETEALGLQESVRFLGHRSDVAEVLTALDIFALPSLSEGLPLSLLEAMAAGVPVVASSVGGIPEVIEHGGNGLLVRPEEPSDIAEKILALLDDTTLRKNLSERGREVVSTRFGMTGMVRAYEGMYRSLLNE